MGYCVFMHRADSVYDDTPAEQYQFPKQYLDRAKSSIGDWIVYLEPSKVSGTRGYFAIARVQQIISDPKASNMYLAVIDPGSYLEFSHPVPFNDGYGPIERGLLNAQRRLSGRSQAAVRPIAPADFLHIVEQGLDDHEPLLPRIGSPENPYRLNEAPIPFVYEVDRDRVLQLTSRVVRDRTFRKCVLRAYGETCAISGLKLINGGGRAEVDAAHIRPVEANGPDIVTNGLELSGTAHWMFDRGLITLNDDLSIVISRQVNDADRVRGFINRSGYAHRPVHGRDHPHPHFLKWHRENCFKA